MGAQQKSATSMGNQQVFNEQLGPHSTLVSAARTPQDGQSSQSKMLRAQSCTATLERLHRQVPHRAAWLLLLHQEAVAELLPFAELSPPSQAVLVPAQLPPQSLRKRLASVRPGGASEARRKRVSQGQSPLG